MSPVDMDIRDQDNDPWATSRTSRREPAQPASVELLTLWERAAAAPARDRDDALLGAPQSTPPASLGARNAALLGLRARLFGKTQELRCDCPRCGATAEFAIDCALLSRELVPADAAGTPKHLTVDGYDVAFRVPDIADLRDAGSAGDDAASLRVLLRRCGLTAVTAFAVAAWLAPRGNNPGPGLNLISIAFAFAALVVGLGNLMRRDRHWPTWVGLVAGLTPAVFWVAFAAGNILSFGE